MIVTIDGPAGSGKSTAAKGLAARLGFRFLDTGAMYRVVAYECLEAGVDPHDEAAATAVAERCAIDFDGDSVFSAGKEVSGEIRTPDVSDAASVVARYPGVREALNQRQRELAVGENMVTEGRDQGTIVFPDAACKFFLVADPQERAKRRRREMKEQGLSVPLAEVTAQIADRDKRDADREFAPLKAAEDAVEIETSQCSIDDVIDALEKIVLERIANPPK